MAAVLVVGGDQHVLDARDVDVGTDVGRDHDLVPAVDVRDPLGDRGQVRVEAGQER